MLMRNVILPALIMVLSAAGALADGRGKALTDDEFLSQIFNYKSWTQVSRTEPNVAGGSFEIPFSSPGGG